MTPRRRRQTGFALWLLLLLVFAAAAFTLRLDLTSPTRRQIRTIQVLAQAKEALIARAAADANRPGSLPCPDMATDSPGLANTPGDGKADLFTMTQCPTYVGWFPWVTLDQPELTDESGTRLWYVLAPSLRDDDSAHPINSDTPTSLRLDGKGDIAALLIAPGSPLVGQSRPSNRPVDYLDGPNTGGSLDAFASGPGSADFNDAVMAITRQELMAAVEQRVANALRTCLLAQARHPANAAHTWPWPAPIGERNFKGTPGALFGRIPDTQPGSPESELTTRLARLSDLEFALNSASTADARLSALNGLDQEIGKLRALAEQIRRLAVDLNAAASRANQAFSTLDTTLANATQNSTAFQKYAAGLPGAASDVLPALAGFRQALADSGFDVFLNALNAVGADLESRLAAARATPGSTALGRLITPVNELGNRLLAYPWTPNTDLDSAIGDAFDLASITATQINAARKSLAGAEIEQALATTEALASAIRHTASVIRDSRTPLDSREIDFLSRRLTALRDELANGRTAPGDLLPVIESIRQTLNVPNTDSGNIHASRMAALNALENLQPAIWDGLPLPALDSAMASAASALSALAVLLKNNGDNVTLETLRSLEPVFNSVSAKPPATLTTARALRTSAKSVLYWSDLATTQTADIARLSRRGIASTEDSDSSVYTLARKLQTAIEASIDKIKTQGRNPSDANAQAVDGALTDTHRQLDALIPRTILLAETMATGLAEAGMPTPWLADACAAQQGTPESTTWWHANQWKHLLFYQITDRILPPKGKLTVNGQGEHSVVVITAGGALPGQQRDTPTTRQYLEGANADPSRDGDANAPTANFTQAPRSSRFNDHLAY